MLVFRLQVARLVPVQPASIPIRLKASYLTEDRCYIPDRRIFNGERTSSLAANVLPYLLIIGALVLVARLIIGLHYTDSRKRFKESTVETVFLIVLVAFAVFLLFMHCIESGLCSL